MTTAVQIKANQDNSKLSTGPKTETGKQTVSENRVTHGILSNRLLSHEDPEEYQALLDRLLSELKPVGALEVGLVEKITIILWRQRRLVQAESAKLELAQSERALLGHINDALGYGNYSDNKLKQEDLEGVDLAQIEWCQGVIDEISSDTNRSSVSAMKKSMPLCYGQLAEEAEGEGNSVDDYFNYQCEQGYGGIGSWLHDLDVWCKGKIKKVDDAEKAKKIIPVIRDKLTILGGIDSITFFQVPRQPG